MAEALRVGAASRPFPGETENGDAWTIQRHGDRTRLTVIDGLGHGPDAAAAAGRAVAALEGRPELDPVRALELCHQALQGSRGAAMAVALVDPAAGTLTYAGVGNVEARLVQNGAEERLISYRGIVGSALPRPRAFERPLAAPWLLLVHSDGVSARAKLPDDALAAEAGSVAAAVLEGWARQSDDATVVVLKG